MMEKLGIKSLRQGANGRDPDRAELRPTTMSRRPILIRLCRIR